MDALALMGEMLKAAQPKGAETTQREVSGKGKLAGRRKSLPDEVSWKESMRAQSLATVKETKPELYEQVRTGKISVTAAHVEVAIFDYFHEFGSLFFNFRSSPH